MTTILFTLCFHKFLPLCRAARRVNYTTSCVLSQQNVIIRGPLVKMMNKTKKKSKKSSNSINKLISDFEDSSLTSGRRHGPNRGMVRRADQLSFVLYDYVTEIVNSGELCPEVASMKVEITEVKMLPNFTAIHVYWMPDGTPKDEIVNDLLKSKQNKMRGLLSSYKPIGKIPEVVFLKDKEREQTLELDKLFKIADYGEDFRKSSEYRYSEKNEVFRDDNQIEELKQLSYQFETDNGGNTEVIHMDIKEQREKKSKKRHKVEQSKLGKIRNEYSDIMEQYRDNLYGVNHSDLTRKIELSKHKLKHRRAKDPDVHIMQADNMEEAKKIDISSLSSIKKKRLERSTRSKNVTIFDYLEEIGYQKDSYAEGDDIPFIADKNYNEIHDNDDDDDDDIIDNENYNEIDDDGYFDDRYTDIENDQMNRFDDSEEQK